MEETTWKQQNGATTWKGKNGSDNLEARNRTREEEKSAHYLTIYIANETELPKLPPRPGLSVNVTLWKRQRVTLIGFRSHGFESRSSLDLFRLTCICNDRNDFPIVELLC